MTFSNGKICSCAAWNGFADTLSIKAQKQRNAFDVKSEEKQCKDCYKPDKDCYANAVYKCTRKPDAYKHQHAHSSIPA